jgi:hypothetical protein
MQKARRQPFPLRGHRPSTVCKLMVSDSISLPYQGFFSPFPHGTCSLSVINEYLALESGLPRFRPGFTCPALLRCQPYQIFLSLTGLSPCIVQLSRSIQLEFTAFMAGPTTPRRYLLGLGSSHFARRYYGNLIRFLFLCLLRCFSSAGLASLSLCIQLRIVEYYFHWVPPFGYLRVKALCPAHRSFSQVYASFIAC